MASFPGFPINNKRRSLYGTRTNLIP